MDHPVARSLIATTYINLGNGSVIVPENECFCLSWLKPRGTPLQKKVANGMQWFAFGFSVLLLMYYAYQTWKSICGWEEVYVCVVELTKVVVEFFHEFDNPAMLQLSGGNRLLWLRYCEWLLTCPVILIHLSNLTGLSEDYSRRTMQLLVSDIGTIVWGATAAMAKGPAKIGFFILGCLYGSTTYFHAAKVYIESYNAIPKGQCRVLVRAMAWIFFATWGFYPVLFLLGPEGYGVMSMYGSTISHTAVDLLSKNVWGLLGHHLRRKVHESMVVPI
ncbi:hypothetical protein Agub_g5726 [Astrephomene gubernaculifera]|uniref:Bacteriorhodopsin n=1 Tax=Astrephomene gubernaculifera TaxID=47775 RepID=A0AAD3HL85_9CHLO|nr:hypothetical protein Agub_g5726 [Astrephomene gubernaculifera]